MIWRPILPMAALTVLSWLIWGFNVEKLGSFWAAWAWALNFGLLFYTIVWAVALATDRNEEGSG